MLFGAEAASDSLAVGLHNVRPFGVDCHNCTSPSQYHETKVLQSCYLGPVSSLSCCAQSVTRANYCTTHAHEININGVMWAWSVLCGYTRTLVKMNEGPNVLIFIPALIITRIKNIKNVTRCRDSRSAKSIETK